MAREVTRWACEHERCKKTYSRKADATRHEKDCIFNPSTKSCPTCAHDMLIEEETETGYRMVSACEERHRDNGVPYFMGCVFWEPIPPDPWDIE